MELGIGVGVMYELGEGFQPDGFQPLGCEPPCGGRLPVEIGGGTLHGGSEPVGTG